MKSHRYTAPIVFTILAALLLGCASPTPKEEDRALVVSVEQAETWVRNFNPLGAHPDVRWPTRGGV